MQHPSRRAALVAARLKPLRDLDEARRGLAVARRLEAILGQRRPFGAAGASDAVPPAFGKTASADGLPLAVRLTMVQIIEVAEDAEIRAEIIDDVSSARARRDGAVIRRIEGPEQIERRVDSLREVAGDLRGIAAQIMDRWAEPERAS